MYWDISRPLSYNALFNFIVGMRGVGKTYGSKVFAIKQFITKGNQFIYLRRYKQEILPIKKDNKFFEDIQKEFNNEFKIEGNTMEIDGDIMGWFQALSVAKIQKSVSFSKVEWIIFDEFIIDKGVYHYIPDEVTNFLEFYNTVARNRDVKVLFLSNAITMFNPYFNYFNIKIDKNKEFTYKEDILVQVVKNEEYRNAAKKSRFGRMIENTPYGNYAIDNEFLRDNDIFIAQKTSEAKHLFIIINNDMEYGVWYDWNAGYFVSYKKDPYCIYRYSLTIGDHQPNTLLLNGNRKLALVNSFIRAFKEGLVFYESQKIKAAVYDNIRKLI